MAYLPFRPCPPRDTRPYLKTLKVTNGPKARFLCVSPNYLGYATHWNGEQSELCVGAEGGCKRCLHGTEARWCGFIAVRRFDAAQPHLLPLSRGAVQYCPSLDRLNGNLRGKTIMVGRKQPANGRPARPNAPMEAELFETPPEVLRALSLPEVSLENALCRLWGLTSLPEQHCQSDLGIPLS